MEEPPKPEFTVVERDGRLVVEKVEQPRKASLENVRLPRLPQLTFDWIRLGEGLLARLHSFDLTEAGHALLTASQLEDGIKLSARPYDLYYLTPRQQAIIGYLGALQRWGFVVLILTVLVSTLILDVSPFWPMLAWAIFSLPLMTYFKDEYEAIRQQLYEPAAADLS